MSSVTYEKTLNPGERARVQLAYDPQAPPTEHLEWALYATPDGASYDATPLHVGSVDKDLADPNAISLIVDGVWGFKVAGRLVDSDGIDGGDDTASAVLLPTRSSRCPSSSSPCRSPLRRWSSRSPRTPPSRAPSSATTGCGPEPTAGSC